MNDSWFEVRVRSADGLRWHFIAGPGDEEWAHDYIDNTQIKGRQLAIVRASVWTTVMV